MFVHPCCCIDFIEWCFFKFKVVLKILLKDLRNRRKNKKEKVLLSPSHSRARPILSLPRPGSPSLLSFSQRGPAPTPGPRQQAAPFSSPQQLTGRSRAPFHRQVGPSGQGHLRPRVWVGHEPGRNHRVRFRASSPFSARLFPFIYPPRCPATPYLNPSTSRRAAFAAFRRQDRSRSHLATAAHSSSREQLAQPQFRFAKSPKLSLYVFVPSAHGKPSPDLFSGPPSAPCRRELESDFLGSNLGLRWVRTKLLGIPVFWFALYRSLSPDWATPANSAMASPRFANSGRPALIPPDLIWALDLRSNGLYGRIPLRPRIFQKHPQAF